MRFKVKNEHFTDLDSALDYVVERGLNTKDIEVCTDKTENLAEKELIPDETSAKTPIEWLRSQKDKGSESVTRRHPANELPVYEEKLSTSNYIREYVLRGIEALKQDPSLPSCPYCSQSWSNIESNLAPEQREQLAVYAGKPLKFKDAPLQEKQDGGVRNQNRQYADKKIPLKIQHLKTQHKGIYKILVNAGVVMQFESATDEYGNTNLKPTNKKNVESLSVEELSDKINADPEKRKLFFRHWMKQLQEGNR